MIPVHEAYQYLYEAACKSERGLLIRPMAELKEHTSVPHTREQLSRLEIDAMDVWIAYHLLGERESSPRGREACTWLALQLRHHLRGPVRRYDKTGAVCLWGLLCRIYRGWPQHEMYRVAAALLIPGRDRFSITPAGPRQTRSDPEICTQEQLHAVAARAAEIREEVRVYYSGRRDRDLAPFLPSELPVARDEWENETRRRVIERNKVRGAGLSP